MYQGLVWLPYNLARGRAFSTRNDTFSQPLFPFLLLSPFRLRTLFRTDRLEPFPQVLAVCDAAAAQAAATAPHVDFPRLCVEAVRHGVENGGLKGIDKEQENFKK